MIRRLVSLAFMMLLAGATFGADWTAQTYTMEPGDLAIPSTRWTGEKYAQGKISVLIFLVEPIHDHNNRQPMELVRATGFDVQYVHMVDYKHQVDNDRARRLLDDRQWDVIMFWHRQEWGNSFGWPADDVKFRILKQVASGAGLVLTDRAPANVFRKDRTIEAPVDKLLAGLSLTGRASRDTEHWTNRYRGKAPASEAALRKGFYTTYKLGKGRGVVYDGKFTFGDHYSKLCFARPFAYDYRIDHEVAFAELARVLVWAAGKGPEVLFAAEPESNPTYTVDTVRRQLPKWTLRAPEAVKSLTVTSRVRDLTGQVHYTDKQQFDNAGEPVDYLFNLPRLGAGRYYVDLFVDSPRGRESWGYWGFAVSPQATLTVAIDPAGHEPGQPAQAKVAVDPVEAGPGKGTLRMRLVDDLDRILDEKAVDYAGQKSFDVRLDTDEHDSMQLRIVADLLVDDVSVGSGWMHFNQLKRRQDRFNVLLWGSFGGTFTHWGKRKLWQTGVTTSMAGRAAEGRMTATPFIAAWNRWTGEVDDKKFSFGHGATKPKPDPKTGVLTMQPTCWNHDQKFETMLSFQDKHWQAGMQQPVYVYNMYDEGPHSGACLDEHCLAAYRNWLKEQYGGDLGKLNAEWQSSYKTWDEVNVLTPGDNTEDEARKQGLYARWSDRKHFFEVNFARRILGGQTRRARSVDPMARIGFEGSGGFGMDFDELIANSGFWCPYDGIQTEMVRSLKPDGYIHSFWIGYTKESKNLTARGWRMVINGAPSIWWWMLKGRTRFHGWLGPNMMPYPENQKFLDDCVLPLRRGLGDLLIDLDMPHDGIALYYSVAAAHAGEIGDSAQYNSVTGAHDNMVKLIEDCGFQWVYTTKKRVLDGGLAKRNIKLLLLPYQQPLSEDEVAALKTFVEAGGTVVADLRPGVYSGHCRGLARGPADALFGIRRTGPGKPEKLYGQATAKLADKDIPIVLRNNRADGQIEPAGAEAGGTISKQPVFLVNTLGKGRAILLNFHLTQYNGEREMGQGRTAREFFMALADAVGIRPRLTRLTADGAPLPRTETVTWTKGSVTLYALYRDGGETQPAEVRLPAQAHVFGLRSGSHGTTDTVKLAALAPGFPEFLAVYPYDPGKPTVRASAAQAAPGEVVRFTLGMTGVPADETGTFSYETVLTDPSGKRLDILPWSTQSGGAAAKAATHVRFAHNDPKGQWTMTVREVTTGRITTATVTLK